MFEPTMLNEDNIQLLHDIYDHLVKKFDIRVPELQWYNKKENEVIRDWYRE